MLKHYNRGQEYLANNKISKAVQQFEQQLQVYKFKECFLNLGMCYKHLGNYDKAVECIVQSTHHTTPYLNGELGCYAMGLHNLGAISYALGDDCSAQAFYKLALQCEPQRTNTMFSLSLSMLRKLCSEENVEYLDAWQYYARRFYTTKPVQCSIGVVPTWDFVKHHKRCVVLREQGFGDQLQFIRYLPQLHNYFSEVVVESLGPLDAFIGNYEICANASESRADVSIPIMSLAHKFGIERSGSWLLNKHYKPKLFAGDKLNIGIEWRGSDQHQNDHNRSCSAELFQQLRRPDIQLYSIRPNAEPQPGVVALNSQSWEESAEIILGLDLVISVDTSLVHLAGCLDKPCWLLQPLYETDWRWGNSSMGTKNIWYDSVQVLRNPHNWQVVFDAVSAKLEQLLTKKRYKMLNTQLQTMLDQM